MADFITLNNCGRGKSSSLWHLLSKLSHGAKSGENFRCFGNPFGLAQDLVDALDGEHC